MNVSHVYTDINPCTDLEIILTELVMADLELVQNRLETLKKGLRLGKKDIAVGEMELLETIQETLSKGICIVDAGISFDQGEMKAWGLLTAKPYVIVANVGEDDITKGSVHLDNLKAWARRRARWWCPSARSSNSRPPSSMRPSARNSWSPSASNAQAPRHSSAPATSFWTSSPSTPLVGKELRAWTPEEGRHDIRGRGPHPHRHPEGLHQGGCHISR
ncbi:MAG: hypothetical protein MZV70_57060 [Desulfobacterales bacterium]|nr:hypothetical protein [Desulfobacterales bacterium]